MAREHGRKLTAYSSHLPQAAVSRAISPQAGAFGATYGSSVRPGDLNLGLALYRLTECFLALAGDRFLWGGSGGTKMCFGRVRDSSQNGNGMIR